MTITARNHNEGTWAGFQLLTCFGLGRLPISGTFGSLPPVLLAGAMIAAGITPADTAYFVVLSGVILLFGGSLILLGDHAIARWPYMRGMRSLNDTPHPGRPMVKKDPSPVVADEVVGVCLPLMVIPASAVQTLPHTIVMLAAAFILFRIFDIKKSIAPPAERAERIPGAWGVLLDDVVSGIYAAVCVLLIQPAGPILERGLALVTG